MKYLSFVFALVGCVIVSSCETFTGADAARVIEAVGPYVVPVIEAVK